MQSMYEKGVLTFKFGVKDVSGDFLKKFDKKINDQIKANNVKKIVFDMEGVKRITSAIIRRWLRMQNYGFDIEIINTEKEVATILAITNLDKIVHVVHKRPKINTKGLKEISRGAYGKVYDYSPDEILKVYYGYLGEEQILRGVQNAKVAFQHGLPVAIPYATVDTSEGIGVLFEKVKGKGLSDEIHGNTKIIPQKMKEMVRLAKHISGTVFQPGELTSIKDLYIDALDPIRRQVPAAYIDAYKIAIESMPDVNTAVHGDLATVNVLDDGFDLMLVDMDTFSFAHPIWDIASMYTAHYYVYLKGNEEETFLYTRMNCNENKQVWEAFEKEYFKGVGKKETQRRVNAAANFGLLRAAALYCQKIDKYDKTNPMHVEFLNYVKPILEMSVMKNLYSMVEIFKT